MIRARWFQLVGSLAIVLWLAGEQTGWWPTQILQRLEWMSYDIRVNQTLRGQAPQEFVLIDIDEASLQTYGQWPWPRQQIATLIEKAFSDYQLQLLGLDLVFAEQEQNLLAQQWQQLQQRVPALANEPMPETGDTALAQVLAQYPVVTGFYFERTGSAAMSTGMLPPPLDVIAGDTAAPLAEIPIVRPDRFASNIEALQAFASAGGFFDNPTVDADGIFRRVPLVQEFNDQLYPSLPLAMVRTLLGQAPVTLDTHFEGGLWQLEGLDMGGFYYPTDPTAAVLVPWYGGLNTFARVSAAAILRGDPHVADKLRNRIAILGTSAPGLMDLRATPVASIFPGMEIHASVLAGLLTMNFKSEPGYAVAMTFIGLLLLGLTMSWLYPRLPAFALVTTSAVLGAAHVGANLYAWTQGLVLPIASGILLIVLLTGWHLALNFWRESRAKRQVASQFGLYVPPELVADIVAAPNAQDLTGQEKQLTVLFSDVRNFTSFAETIPPAQLTAVMNQLLSPVTRAIHEHRGTIDKYMGDAVMAFWGAPLPDAKHALHAVQGAVAMQRALRKTNHEFAAQNLPELAMGIGIHTGIMNVGNMGSDFRMAYTVLGDNVNLGSRIEGLTKNYGADILISDDTLEALGVEHELCIRPVDLVRVKGRETPVMLHEVVLNPEHQATIAQVQFAWNCYRNRDFAEAEKAYSSLAGDQLGLLFAQRCNYYQQNPPLPEWDGVFTHTYK
ncbi:MAG TPA: adenylate/guanylate cyclase domain-containing protein [Pseudidiomarina sp.]|nr:adenylate/guanylate cyclase domain-containing protein [Pseudidiomarina sp.]